MPRKPPREHPPGHLSAPRAEGNARGRPRRPAPRHADGLEDADGAKNPYIRFRPLRKPPLEPALTTLWEYPSQHYGKGEQGSSQYRGATPSWVIWQVMQRYSQPGDLVLDPFCGSGTTLDVAKDLHRSARGFDLQPTRPDIELGDARALPLAEASVPLVFMDPPYADNLVYSEDPRCIGKTRADDRSYFDAMADVFAETARVLAPGGHLAVYVQDILATAGRASQPSFYPLGIELGMMARHWFVGVDHVAVVRHNKDLSRGEVRKAAAERGFLLRGFNHLLVFQKPVERAGATRGSRSAPSTSSNRAAAGGYRPEASKRGGPGGAPPGRKPYGRGKSPPRNR